MNRQKRNEFEVREEHATLVSMPHNRIGARVSHHVQRYINAELWDKCCLWRFHKEALQGMAECPEEVSDDVAKLSAAIPEILDDLAISMAEEIADGSFQEPKEKYSVVQNEATDVKHMRYIVSFYVLRYSVKYAAFVPVRSKRHRKYGYLAYWREGELERVDLRRVKREESAETYEAITVAQTALREAAAFRSVNDLAGHTSLGSELYRTIGGVSVLEPQHVITAASRHYAEELEVGDPRISEYVSKHLVNKPVPKAWLQEEHGEKQSGFHLDTEVLPAVILPKHVKQRLWLSNMPEPMMDVDKGLNTPDAWQC